MKGRRAMKKVIILIGNYGSGKTEIALNMAVKAAGEGKRTQVIDLDRINDYFRMSDHVKLLEDSNINLVSPTFVGAGITQTNMPAAVGSAFAQDWDLVIFDVGGDPAGALSLARYHMDFAALEPGQLEVYDIVNIRRPMSETAEKILKLKEEMEGFARQTVTGFINNSNLQTWASADDLRDGYPVVKAASEMSGIPVVHTTGRKEFLDAFLADGNWEEKYIGVPLALEPYMRREWNNLGI
jgi:cellulose biosynthesis protein BcsQ